MTPCISMFPIVIRGGQSSALAFAGGLLYSPRHHICVLSYTDAPSKYPCVLHVRSFLLIGVYDLLGVSVWTKSQTTAVKKR